MFVKTEGPATANMYFVGEAPGEEEDKTGRPFRSNAPAGHTFDLVLNQANIVRQECMVANVARERPPGNNISFYFEDSKCTVPKPMMKAFIEYLRKEIATLKPNIVIPLGDIAAHAIMGEKGITGTRGYICESTLVPGQKVLPTYHPQAINYEWNLHWQVIMDLRKAVVNSHTPDMPRDERILRASVSKHEYLDYLQWLQNDHKGPIAVDIETSSPGSHVDIIGIADSPNHAVSFSLLQQREPRYNTQGELEVWRNLAEVLGTKPLIMQNASYDVAVLWYNNRVFCRHILADTMVATHVCWPEVPRNLGFQASICLNVPRWKHLQYEMPTYYNCCDAANTYGIWMIMEGELDKLGQRKVFEFEMSQIEPAIMMQLQGLYVDNEKRSTMRKETKNKLVAVEAQLETEIGRKVNFNSHQQMRQLLYVDMNLPVQFARKKKGEDLKKITTDERAMKKLVRSTGNPVLKRIVEAKKLSHRLSSFIDFSTSPEGRVHTSYNVTGATMQRKKKSEKLYDEEESFKSFGRWSSSGSLILPYGPKNLQNIPTVTRVFYTAGKGKKYIKADYVQAEAVVVAYLSNDHKLKKMYKDSFGASKKKRIIMDWDAHRMKASELFRIPIKEVNTEQRRIGRELRHARNYDAGPGVLSHKLDISMKEAKELIQIDKEMNPQLLLWHQRVQNQLRQTKILTNRLGRKHKFLGRWPRPGESGDLFRSAYSYDPQSTVGDLLNKSLVKVYEEYGETIDIAIQLHDAIYTITDEAKVDETIVILRECMLHPLYHDGEEFTIDIDFAVGDSWGELEDVNIEWN